MAALRNLQSRGVRFDVSDLVFEAVQAKQTSALQFLIEMHAAVDDRNKYGETPSFEAIARRCASCLDLLLGANANLSQQILINKPCKQTKIERGRCAQNWTLAHQAAAKDAAALTLAQS